MAKFAFILLISLTLHSALSYYGQPPYPTRVVYRHHVAPYQPQMPFMSPVPQAVAVPYAPQVVYGPPAPPAPIHMGAARPVPYFAPAPIPHPMPPHLHYIPAASHQQNHYAHMAPSHMPPSHMAPSHMPPSHMAPSHMPPSHMAPSHMAPSHMAPSTSPRHPIRNMFSSPFGGYSQQSSKPSIFTKIKPYIFGGTGPRSLPHHPYYPNMYHPHQFAPNRPFHNRPSAAHHSFPVHAAPPPALHHPGMVMKPQKSCSCSLHVGQLTVYKHTDMRSSYSCNDLKDCNSFCTNLFSSEDLRAQTRADACLILGKDTKVPWFRRDHVCEPHGVKNDTKLSVDLCCKNLQPC